MHYLDIKKRISSVVIGLIVALAMIISSCDAVTGVSGDAAGDPAALAPLSASRSTQIVGINIGAAAQLAQIGINPAYPANGSYDLTTNLTLANWVPVCDPARGGPFVGTFNGHGYTITVSSFDPAAAQGTGDLGIFADTAQNTAAFAQAAFSNLTVNIAAPQTKYTNPNIGALVGNATNAAFDNITVTGAFNADLVNGDQNLGGVAGKAVSAQFTNVTVNADFPVNSVTGAEPTVNIGGVAGLAQSSTFSGVTVRGSYTNNLTSPAPAQNGRLVKAGSEYIFQGVTTPGSDGLNVGGVAGHVEASQFSATGLAAPSLFKAIVSNIKINATSTTTPVYLGGVAGYANGATIENAQVTGDITGRGDGYNTSAGGVAGYIIASRVLDSSAAVSVNLQGLGVNFDDYDSWQIDAGGLVGYVGGSDYAPSLIDHSYATGAVTAYSPFPYAGGLVGYLYGYNDFSNPAKNGGTVSRSYATGEVRSESQADPNGVYGDIPYAGGLVGYSSVKGSTIVDSYARGNVYAVTRGTFAWAGGVVGGNVNDAVVLRVYATGNVLSNAAGDRPPIYPAMYADAGPAAGGIAGYNNYTANTRLSDSVALNNNVNGNQTTQNVVHRVAGGIGDGSGHDGVLEDNLAYEKMTVGDNWVHEYGADKRDGANTAATPAQPVYADLGWDFANTWAIGSDGYPVIQ
jgi:hypothetical protein